MAGQKRNGKPPLSRESQKSHRFFWKAKKAKDKVKVKDKVKDKVKVKVKVKVKEIYRARSASHPPRSQRFSPMWLNASHP